MFKKIKQYFCRHIFEFVGRADMASKYRCKKCGKIVYDRR